MFRIACPAVKPADARGADSGGTGSYTRPDHTRPHQTQGPDSIARLEFARPPLTVDQNFCWPRLDMELPLSKCAMPTEYSVGSVNMLEGRGNEPSQS